MEKEQPRWAEVFQVSMPLCLSYIPIGVACGILLNAAGFNPLMTVLVSLLVFSGGAQFREISLCGRTLLPERAGIPVLRSVWMQAPVSLRAESYVRMLSGVQAGAAECGDPSDQRRFSEKCWAWTEGC